MLKADVKIVDYMSKSGLRRSSFRIVAREEVDGVKKVKLRRIHKRALCFWVEESQLCEPNKITVNET
jgi:hypothetical protein